VSIKNWQIALVLSFGVISVSTAAIFVRLCQQISGLNGVGFSLFIASSRLIITAFIILPTWKNLKQEKCEQRAYYYALSAGFCLALHFAFWITSLSYTSIAISTTLVTTNPIWVTIISWFWLKEKPNNLTICGIIIALIGGLFIANTNSVISLRDNNQILGGTLSLIGGFMASLYLIFSRKSQSNGLSIKSYIAIAYTTAALVLLPLPLLFNYSYFGYPNLVYLYLILMALIPQLIGHTSFNWSIKFTSPILVSLAILFEPVGSSFLAWLIFDESISNGVLSGAVILLLGVAFVIIGQNKQLI
jgi:drug/metabolite transporter (DMT)-like permease